MWDKFEREVFSSCTLLWSAQHETQQGCLDCLMGACQYNVSIRISAWEYFIWGNFLNLKIFFSWSIYFEQHWATSLIGHVASTPLDPKHSGHNASLIDWGPNLAIQNIEKPQQKLASTSKPNFLKTKPHCKKVFILNGVTQPTRGKKKKKTWILTMWQTACHFSSIHLSFDPLDQALSVNLDNLHIQLVNFLGHVFFQGLKTSLHPSLIWRDDISSTSCV